MKLDATRTAHGARTGGSLHPDTAAIRAAAGGGDGLAPTLSPSTAFGASDATDAARRARRARVTDFYGR
ncbi:MAG: hypothetical protein P8N02_17985 [Actinomycetota bacterium]|nr:hypothetical protein [Actinomycetota bacterium]